MPGRSKCVPVTLLAALVARRAYRYQGDGFEGTRRQKPPASCQRGKPDPVTP